MTAPADNLLSRLEFIANNTHRVIQEEIEATCDDAAALIRSQAARIVRLEKALEDAAQALYNSFEPDNQSRAYHEARRALKGEE